MRKASESPSGKAGAPEWGAGITGPVMKSLNLPGDTRVNFGGETRPYYSWSFKADDPAYCLEADHPYYTVLAHNEKHGLNFVLHMGSEEAPADYAGEKALMRNGGKLADAGDCRWTHEDNSGDIIGYVPRTEEAAEQKRECGECNGSGVAERIEGWDRPCDACHGEGLLDYSLATYPTPPGYVLMKQMTEEDVLAIADTYDWQSPSTSRQAFLVAWSHLGLIAPPAPSETHSQRYERETGEKVTPAMEAYREWAMKGEG